MNSQRRQVKTCARCGRKMEWRKRWSKSWGEVKHCSAACSRRGLRASDKALEVAILVLLNARGEHRSICPSEAARKVAGAAGDQWKGLMEDTRNAARRLAAAGRVVITQGGAVQDPSTVKGPIRIAPGRARSHGAGRTDAHA